MKQIKTKFPNDSIKNLVTWDKEQNLTTRKFALHFPHVFHVIFNVSTIKPPYIAYPL